MQLTTRNRNVISGLIAVVFVTSAIILSISWAFGSFDDTWTLRARFDAAGQGLQKGSDVKVRGVNIGKVRSVSLDGIKALVTMDIQHGQEIPRSASLTVRPKTLFGEKFVDVEPGADEASTNAADFYPSSGDVTFIGQTTGGFELERVLAAAYPLLKAIKPEDLMTVLDELASATQGLGSTVNRQLVNGKKVLDVFAARDAEQRQFLTDLNTIAGQLGNRAEDITALARSLNSALPTLTSRGDQLTQLLDQTSRLSNDVADLLENNQDFINSAFNEGQAVLDTLDAQRQQVIPLVSGLASYVRWLAEVIRIPVGDGTYMAAVKGLLGTQSCLLGLCSSAAAGAPGTTTALPAPAGGTPAVGATPAGTGPPSSDDAVSVLLRALGQLGRRQ